jgi:hypothetical protein
MSVGIKLRGARISQLFSCDKRLNLKTLARLEQILGAEFHGAFRAGDSKLDLMSTGEELHPQFVLDVNGNKKAVLLPIEEYDESRTVIERVQY